MQNTILHKLLSWIVASSVSLLALLISFFIIIFSLYPDLAPTNNLNLIALKTYYDICDISKTDNVEINEIKIDNNVLREDTVKQIIIIDRTSSGIIDHKKYGNFKKSLSLFLTKQVEPYCDSVKISSLEYINDYIFLSCAKSLFISKKLSKNRECVFYLYNGTKEDGIKIEGNIDDLVDVIYNHNAIVKSRGEYYTNIIGIIDSIIPDITNNISNFNLTLISDMFHDVPHTSIVNCHLKKMRKMIGDNSMNLVIIDHDKIKTIKYKSQNDFLNMYRNYFDGTSNDTINRFLYIDLENYTDEFYCDCNSDILELEKLFKSNYGKINKITFETPIESHNNFEVATAKLCFSKNDIRLGYRWRFRSSFNDNNTVILHKTKSSYERYFYEPGYDYSVNSTDTLELQIKTKPDAVCNYDDLKFCISYKEGNYNRFIEYAIDVKKVHFPIEYKNILLNILDVFCFLLILIIISGECLLIEYVITNHKKRDIWYLVFILLLLCYFLYAGYRFSMPVWPFSVLMVTIASIIINIFIIFKYTQMRYIVFKNKLIIFVIK